MGKCQYSKHESDQRLVCPPSFLFGKHFKEKPNGKALSAETHQQQPQTFLQ